MKKYLLTGLIILLPVALTLVVIFFLFDLFTEPFVSIVGPLVKFIQAQAHIKLPTGLTLFLSRLLSLIFLCIFILILGIFTQHFLVKMIIDWSNKVLFRIPFVKTVYKTSKDIFAALFSTEGKKAFKRPVMMPFPSRPNHCVGFEVGEVTAECQQKVDDPLTAVFVPTAPHPISGFLFLVKKSDVHEIDMTNEDVVKFLVSCGMILPESDAKDCEDEHLF